jgi:phosphate transport system permease protein
VPSIKAQMPFAATVGPWSVALATALVLTLLGALMVIVAVNAAGRFWPTPVWRFDLRDGGHEIGEIVGRESSPSDRIKLKVGNRDHTGSDFKWIETNLIVDRRRPVDVVRVSRRASGDAYGHVVTAVGLDGKPVAPLGRARLERELAAAQEIVRQIVRLRSELARMRLPLQGLERQVDALRRQRGEASVPDALLDRLQRARAEIGATTRQLENEIQRRSARLRSAMLVLHTADGVMEIPVENVIDVVWVNQLSVTGRIVHATRELGLFLVQSPRQANTEGGIGPALFGTVLMVLLMTVAVMPLGVLTAVWMTEYAREGPVLRIATTAIDSLAAVPSIVIGMFGLAFFVYGLGSAVDGTLFSDRLPEPTFGTGGLLWASLTLAVLTVPVVVVATREGLQAVPGSWRDAARALGATRWQTLRKVVLPAASPAMLTGLILAVGRAAGEVAPLMLTGAVKLAPVLPIDSNPPFLHLDRKFMHLGFHIYDVSMQSPNVEAAKPMAFASTLVLIVLVLAINLTAIVIRRRLRRAYRVVED